ncbi:Nucleosome assembly protein [Entamoeba marina]
METIAPDLYNVETIDDYFSATGRDVHIRVHALQRLQDDFRSKRLRQFEKTYNITRKLRVLAEPYRQKTIEISQAIPCFWGRILNVADLNYNNISDATALKYLKEVIVQDFPLTQSVLGDGETPAFIARHRVRFLFHENKLMESTEAVKTVSYKVCGWNNPQMEMLEPEVETEIPIVWLPGKDPRVSRRLRRKGIDSAGSQITQKVVPSFFHLFDDIQNTVEDGEYGEAVEAERELERKMQFKVIMGFVREFVDYSISYFDESIADNNVRAGYENFDDDDEDNSLDDDDDEEFLSRMEEEEIEVPQHLQVPPDCNAQ